MPQSAETLEKSMRTVRIVYVVLFFAMILSVFTAEKLSHQEPRDIRAVWLGLLVNGLMVVGVAQLFRIKMLEPAAETLQANPDDPIALGRWRTGNLLSFLLAESIVLFGMALRFIGGTTMQSLPFCVVGIAMMLVWWPRRP
jgi:hypothetical protein